MLKLTKNQLISFVAYAGFFFFCFVVAAYFTFPYHRVRDLLVSQVASPTMTLSIGELGPHWLTGVELHDVKLTRASAVAGEEPSHIELDEATVSISPLAMLFGTTKMQFSAAVGDGELDGSYEGSDAGPHHIEAELENMDLGRLGLGAYLGVPLKGLASGPLDVTIAEKPAETQGEMTLAIDGLVLGDGKAKVKLPSVPGGFTLEAINAGKLDLKLTIREGVATIEKLEAKGKDVELSGSGSLSLLWPLTKSRADIMLGAKFLDAYKKRNDRTKMIFELMDNNPSIKAATGADGMMRFKVAGPVTALQANAGAASGRRIGRQKVNLGGNLGSALGK